MYSKRSLFHRLRLTLALAGALIAISPTQAQQPEQGTRLVLLGTAGGPSLKAARAQPANALVVNGAVYIIDAGNGVARQMELARIDPRKMRAVFITHNHSDHMADYGTLLLRAWASGLKQPVDTFGPPPLAQMTRAYLEYADWDIQLRKKDEGRPDLSSMIRAHEIKADGVIYQDENVKVTAFEVPHDAAKPSYGLRFDMADKSIVFSGDATRSDNLIRYAKGADILVHEVVSHEGVQALVQTIDPGNRELVRHIVDAHTPADQVGEVASAAGVKKLVLTHFVPTGLPAYDNVDAWTKGVRKTYEGELVVGQDLLEVR